MMCVYEREWIVSKKSQQIMHDSSSGLETYGRYASAGPLPCTESNSV